MSDTTETETDTNTDNTDEPSKAELHDRVRKLESTVEKLMPSRRDALRMGAAGLAGMGGLSATTQTAEASTGSAGTIGSTSDRPDLFADQVDANSLTGSVKNQGCRVFLSSNQNITQGSASIIEFDSEVYDSDNNFDTATHTWTCPNDGLHAVNVQVQFDSGASDDDRFVRVGRPGNTTPSSEGTNILDSGIDPVSRVSTSTINRYTQGDEIIVDAVNNSNNDELGGGNSNRNTFLEVAFLGGL